MNKWLFTKNVGKTLAEQKQAAWMMRKVTNIISGRENNPAVRFPCDATERYEIPSEPTQRGPHNVMSGNYYFKRKDGQPLLGPPQLLYSLTPRLDSEDERSENENKEGLLLKAFKKKKEKKEKKKPKGKKKKKQEEEEEGSGKKKEKTEGKREEKEKRASDDKKMKEEKVKKRPVVTPLEYRDEGPWPWTGLVSGEKVKPEDKPARSKADCSKKDDQCNCKTECSASLQGAGTKSSSKTEVVSFLQGTGAVKCSSETKDTNAFQGTGTGKCGSKIEDLIALEGTGMDKGSDKSEDFISGAGEGKLNTKTEEFVLLQRTENDKLNCQTEVMAFLQGSDKWSTKHEDFVFLQGTGLDKYSCKTEGALFLEDGSHASPKKEAQDKKDADPVCDKDVCKPKEVKKLPPKKKDECIDRKRITYDCVEQGECDTTKKKK